jgi:hypothetical protein
MARAQHTGVSSSTPPQAGRSVAVGLFESEAPARRALQALATRGVSQAEVGILVPGAPMRGGQVPTADVSGLLMAANRAGDVTGVLVSMGVPEGEARFYANEVGAGHTLIVAEAGQHYAQIREALLQNGAYDVESRGETLARDDGAGLSGGTGPRPIDLTGDWTDVASRYEMLFAQHYGTTDLTWQQMEPVYQYAWQAANAPARRGRPWSEVADEVRRDWERSTPALAWDVAEGPIRDVWDDVAADASTGAEGGQDRRIPRQGTDQSVPARDVVPPGGVP